ncbi:MAG: DNA cytosine methyltransferase [bacterium]|nr:DNA cytosine methyltransferase [bacterium]
MEKYKILNLYACLGGNRYKWDEVAGNLEITSVELDPELARLYQERFPNDKVIIGDAHQYLLDHYKEFDFIWSSPPCPTHSRIQTSLKDRDTFKPYYPDMNLYQEIIFLEQFFKGKYCIENVIPYYDLLIPGSKRGRHIYWTNFKLPEKVSYRCGKIGGLNEVNKLCAFHDYDFYQYKGTQRKDKIARNLVDYEAGRTILETAMNIQRQNNSKQLELHQ